MFKAGEWVGVGLWANRQSHPSAWGKPILGRVIDPADYRVWANTFEFPTPFPDIGKVMSLVLKYKAEGKLDHKVPVEWHMGSHKVIQWELVSRLRSSKDEYCFWNAAKAQRLDEIHHPRRRTKRPLSDFLPEDAKHLVPA